MKTFTIATISAVSLAGKLNQYDHIERASPLLAQTETKKHTCLTAMERNKAPVPDFWKILKGSTQYVDKDYSTDASYVYWGDMKEKDQLYWSEYTWKRAVELGSDYSLLGNGFTADDINQGGCGNCWVLAAASAIAEHRPELLQNAFLNKDKALNQPGIYAVTLYPLGVPHTVVVDDYLYRFDQPGYVPSMVFATEGPDKSLWGPLLEKALSKYAGNFEHM